MDKGILPGFLALASPYAAFAIFAMTTVGQCSIASHDSLAHLYHDSPGYILHPSNRCPENFRQPSRGAIHSRAISHEGSTRLGRQYHLHLLDTLHLRNSLVAHQSTDKCSTIQLCMRYLL